MVPEAVHPVEGRGGVERNGHAGSPVRRGLSSGPQRISLASFERRWIHYAIVSREGVNKGTQLSQSKIRRDDRKMTEKGTDLPVDLDFTKQSEHRPVNLIRTF